MADTLTNNSNNNKRILLHMCCAPCTVIPLERLRSEGFGVEGLFFNPNIQPEEEMSLRKKTLEGYADSERFGLTASSDMYLKEWIKVGADNPARCTMCYEIRMRAAAAHAANSGFSSFSTTLLVSPYQNHQLIADIGAAAGRVYGVEFVYRDFRDGFYDGQNKAREAGLYRQKYCGCIFSKTEAEHMQLERKAKKAVAAK